MPAAKTVVEAMCALCLKPTRRPYGLVIPEVQTERLTFCSRCYDKVYQVTQFLRLLRDPDPEEKEEGGLRGGVG